MTENSAGGETATVQTGIAGLDHILRGGLPAGALYLVEGDPGSGKTTLGMQFLLEGVKRGERVLYVTLSETRVELLAVARSHGWDLSGVDVHELTSSEIAGLGADDQYTLFHPSEVELAETTKAMLEVVDAIRPSRIVIDSLSEVRLLAREPLRYRRQILALKHFFAGRTCTVLLLDDKTAQLGDLQLHSLAHGVIAVEQLAPEYGSERRRLRVVKLRGVAFRGGYHDAIIERGGLTVFPRLVAAESRSSTHHEVARTGIPELDMVFGGGLDKGSSTLFIGPAGSGKSALSTQIAFTAAKAGDRSAFYLFDEGLETFFRRSEGLGLNIAPYVANGMISLTQIDPAELSPGEFADRIRREVEQGDMKVVVIDSLNGYIHAMPQERFLLAQLHELFMFLRQRGVLTISILAQAGMLGTTGAPVDISYLADNVVLLRFFEAAGALRQAISMVKKRSGNHERTIRELLLQSGSISLGEPLREFQGVLTGVPQLIGRTPLEPMGPQ